MEVTNALAFDVENLATVNLVELLFKVMQFNVIHGFSFTEFLKHTLKESFRLKRHTNVLHFSGNSAFKYTLGA